jgi:rare lipoprotein A
MPNRLVLGLGFALSGCIHRPPPVPSLPPQFVVGAPYQTGGEWQYPRAFDSYDVTGLSTVIAAHATYDTDQETYDPTALAAASPVLQLPSIVTITNLVTGYAMDVRVNDRGPAVPGRVIAVTPRVAQLLGFPPDGVVEVEVTLKPQETSAIDTALGQGPKLTAAPVAGIQAQQLAPPGSSQAAGPSEALNPQDDTGPAAAIPPMSGRITVFPPSPGPLYVQVPGFGRVSDARETAAQLYGFNTVIVPQFDGSRTLYAVNAGPYHSVADADAALQRMLSMGISDPAIIVR